MKNLDKSKNSILFSFLKIKAIIFLVTIVCSAAGASAQSSSRTSYTMEEMLEEGSTYDNGDWEGVYDPSGFGTIPSREWIVAQHIYQLWEIRAIDNVISDPLIGIRATNLNVVRSGWTLGTLTVTNRSNYGVWESGMVTVGITAEINISIPGIPPFGRAYSNSHTYVMN